MAQPTERFVDHDGGRLYVRDHPGANPAIVAMHGFPDDSRVYDRLVGRLAPQRVVTFDWLGYGRSSRRDSAPFTAIDRQRDLLAVLHALELDQVMLVGHDASGPEAIEFAVAHPDRIVGLGLLNTYYGRTPDLRLPEMIALMADPKLGPLADALLDDLDHRLWLLRYTGRRLGIDNNLPPDGIGAISIIPQFFGDGTHPDALAEIRAWTADIPQALDRQDSVIASGRLQTIAASAAVIFGRDDPNLNPDVARHVSSLFKTSSLHLLDGASHWPQWDRPEVVAELIRQSLAAT
jgi:haloalkane dehalogenase